jgi:D-serine deaminase-like pyridoxal phosphate-dependent protein
VDAGLNRCGVRTIQDAMDLANLIMNLPNINLRGIQAYEGRVKGVNAGESLQSLIANGSLVLAIEVKKALIFNGHPVEIMSCASTGTVLHTARIPEVTEVQPGSYALMETAYKASEIGLPFEQALFVLATVCSVYKDRVVLTAGKKAITIDQGFPVVMNDILSHMEFHEEHAILTNSEDITKYHIGETVTLIPSHCCTTVNQHEHLFCVRDGLVEAVWEITARGRYD